MLVGRPPFKCATEYLTFQKVMKREFIFPDDLSSEAKDLIEQLLVSV
jgi:3-phosphoinositide dependent protein kinase-1